MGLAAVEALACAAHAQQQDKSGQPYVVHLRAVADGVRSRGGSDAQIAAAWLHDSVEDGVLSRRWLAGAELAPEVKAMVLALTKLPGEPMEEYAARILGTPGALLVKEADLAHNADPERLALLDAGTERRLAAKYARMKALLGLEGDNRSS
ncbi:HD domain-containing protein [Streptomyces sp. NPDC006879]|uniref:HD domain-containing protein n=1 Tax=Streptomyces sp. NPDC006879 TaxID=3364767 RepID=UPI0036CF82B9